MRNEWKMLVAASLLFAGTQSARARTVQCPHCTDVQIYEKARTLGAGPTAHIVWNPVNGAVKRFRNYCGSAPNGADPQIAKDAASQAAGCRLQTEELAVAADLVAVASALSEVWHETRGTFKGQIRANIDSLSFPAYLPSRPTAHDFQNDLQLQSQLVRMASTPQIFQLSSTPLAGPIVRILAHVDAFFSMTQGVFVSAEVVFADGSQITLMVKLNENATYVANSAIDGSGHSLPDFNGSNRYPGSWYFPPGQGGDMAAFIEYMRQLGVTITSGSANGGVIQCTWIPSTNTTTCVVPR